MAKCKKKKLKRKNEYIRKKKIKKAAEIKACRKVIFNTISSKQNER